MTKTINVEHLLGCKVCDANGKKIGRIEEIIAAHRENELVVTEFHVGRRALAERLSALRGEEPQRIKWRDLDLSDPEHPRLR